MKKILFCFLAVVSTQLFAQDKLNIDELNVTEEYDNLKIQKLYSDSLSTSFIIWIKKEVKSHKHLSHSENIYVLDGEGEMKLGEKNIKIRKGDFIHIPFNTVHSLTVLSVNPVKVLSIQSPLFDGTDRILVD
jgi:quercetin dioxygenase-like cupin family protein